MTCICICSRLWAAFLSSTWQNNANYVTPKECKTSQMRFVRFIKKNLQNCRICWKVAELHINPIKIGDSDALRDWCYLYNFENVKNTHGGVLLLVKLQETNRATHNYDKHKRTRADIMSKKSSLTGNNSSKSLLRFIVQTLSLAAIFSLRDPLDTQNACINFTWPMFLHFCHKIL